MDGAKTGRVGRQYSTFLIDSVARIANTRFFSAPLSWRAAQGPPPIATTQDSSAVLGVPEERQGESSPSARGCGDDHGHPLPAGWFGCTAAGSFRIRQDRSRQPVRGTEGTASPLSRNCFAGQRMGWDVLGNAWLAMGWNRLVGGTLRAQTNLVTSSAAWRRGGRSVRRGCASVSGVDPRVPKSPQTCPVPT